MTWTLYPIARFAELAPQWDALQARTAALPFLESAYLLPLLAEFGNGKEWLAVDESSGSWRNAALLTQRRAGLWETFQPSQLPLGAWLADSGAELDSLARALCSKLPGLALGLGFSQLDPLLQTRPASDGPVRTQDYIDTAWLDIDGDFETYWESRGKNLRQNCRKQRNKLEADGVKVSLDCLRDPAQMAEAIRDYGLLESQGWKAASGTAVQAGNGQGRFYQAMLENFCRLGRGRVYRYRFDDKVVSMDLCIEHGPTLVILKTSYDESYRTISPATLMRQEQFGALFGEKQIRRIEFYGKVMEWHTRWTEQRRTLYHATVYRWSLLRRLHSLLGKWRQPAAAPEQAVHPS